MIYIYLDQDQINICFCFNLYISTTQYCHQFDVSKYLLVQPAQLSYTSVTACFQLADVLQGIYLLSRTRVMSCNGSEHPKYIIMIIQISWYCRRFISLLLIFLELLIVILVNHWAKHF